MLFLQMLQEITNKLLLIMAQEEEVINNENENVCLIKIII